MLIDGGAVPTRLTRLAKTPHVYDVSAGLESLHLQLTLDGPFDLVVDACTDRSGRVDRFRWAFFHLRRNGRYLLLDAADEARASGPKTLRKHLTELGSAISGPSVRGRDLLIVNRTRRALPTLDEAQTNGYLTARAANGRVLDTVAAKPNPQPVFREGPIARSPRIDRPIGQMPLTLREYTDVLVGPRQIVGNRQALFSDSFRHLPSGRHRRIRFPEQRFAVISPRWPSEPPVLDGTYLYLDNEFRGHFGHLLTDTAGRIWTWERAREIDPDVRALVSFHPRRPQVTAWEYELYEGFGIPRDRITLIDAPVRVRRLIAGTSAFANPTWMHPSITDAWDTLGDNLAAQAEAADRPRRIFLSREGLDHRSCRNTDEVEAIFARYGFTVVYPEQHPLPEQVALFRAADVIAGFSGSGVFQMALAKQPKRVILLSHSAYGARNEYFIAAARGHEVDAVISRPDEPERHASFFFDVDQEGKYLSRLLDGLP